MHELFWMAKARDEGAWMRTALLAVPAYNQVRGKDSPPTQLRHLYPWPRQLFDPRQKIKPSELL